MDNADVQYRACGNLTQNFLLLADILHQLHNVLVENVLELPWRSASLLQVDVRYVPNPHPVLGAGVFGELRGQVLHVWARLPAQLPRPLLVEGHLSYRSELSICRRI